VLPSIGVAAENGTETTTDTEQKTETTASASTGLRTLFRDLGADFAHLPSVDSAVVASIGGGLALGLHPLDDDVNQRLARDGGFFKAGDIAGNTLTLMGASMGAYGLGRAFGDNRIAHVGLDLMRAQIVTEGIVQSLKYTVQRPRPDGSSGYSFPSGHAAVTFATATVLDRHHSWRVSLPAYAFATYVSTSRLHDNVHNLSDVAFGAAVGVMAGRTVTRHGASNFALVPEPTRGGVAVMFVRTPKTSSQIADRSN
jgi:PAP2 superfamily